MKQVTSQFLDVLYEEKNGKPVVTTMTFFFVKYHFFFDLLTRWLVCICFVLLYFLFNII